MTIGEAMVVLYPDRTAPLAEAERFGSDIGGAEFNVATSVARLGVPAAWISRLGADGFGDRILAAATEAGVDTSAVERDPARPTGLYVKETTREAGETLTRMLYYRRDSAASALAPGHLGAPGAAALLRGAAYVHTSGITAALSPTAAQAMAGLLEAIGPRTTLSVDLNYRPQLWRDRDPEPLRSLIAQADVLFTGRDEAETFLGHIDPARVFADHPRLRTLVVKEDALRASSYKRSGSEVHSPCLTVDVVEPVGAGDAFAAGFLVASVRGSDDAAALRLGHAVAALTLIGRGDRPATVPTAAECSAIAAATSDEWNRWVVAPDNVPWQSARV
ncbi:sugar kinase [Leifsonia sp. NPDC014704]|uniref:sugar kinase n=1 Tax=Leifsonia sp. NPDC014704 TaxID=3364123 RepID=UPI0036F49928